MIPSGFLWHRRMKAMRAMIPSLLDFCLFPALIA